MTSDTSVVLLTLFRACAKSLSWSNRSLSISYLDKIIKHLLINVIILHRFRFQGSSLSYSFAGYIDFGRLFWFSVQINSSFFRVKSNAKCGFKDCQNFRRFISFLCNYRGAGHWVKRVTFVQWWRLVFCWLSFKSDRLFRNFPRGIA